LEESVVEYVGIGLLAVVLLAGGKSPKRTTISSTSTWSGGAEPGATAGDMGRLAGGGMSRLAVLVEMAPDLFERVAAGADADADLNRAANHSLEQLWDSLHVVLRSKGPPLSLAISGDCRHPLCPHNLDEYREGGHDYYLGLASPRLVGKVAEALANVTASDYKQWQTEAIRARRLDPQYDGGVIFFPYLKAAYSEAAARKNGLMVVIA
jgi:hypothetical protein